MSAAIAFGIAALLTPFARRVAIAVGLVDRPSDPTLAIHARPVPILGGLAVVAATLASVALLGDELPGAIVVATLIAFAIGIVDDIRPLHPAPRVLLLAGAGVVLAAGGVRIDPLGAIDGAATVMLAIASANATNLIDGQNGLAGGLGAAAALGLAGVAGGAGEAVSIGLALAGALAGFLVWNLPGRIFLGNGGAYAIGVLLAALASVASSAHGWRGVLGAAMCLSVFGFEVLFTIVRRIGSGAALTAGDRQHAYDLVAARSTRGGSTATFWIAGAVCAALGIAIRALPFAAGAALFALFAAGAAVWGRRLWLARERPAP
jgi:UDP-N-acetylmuramyl pentapeptide phosphotransferase/UDP-N-acetylglucosamine-1-phosphate transferase